MVRVGGSKTPWTESAQRGTLGVKEAANDTTLAQSWNSGAATRSVPSYVGVGALPSQNIASRICSAYGSARLTTASRDASGPTLAPLLPGRTRPMGPPPQVGPWDG